MANSKPIRAAFELKNCNLSLVFHAKFEQLVHVQQANTFGKETLGHPALTDKYVYICVSGTPRSALGARRCVGSIHGQQGPQRGDGYSGGKGGG